MTKSWEPDTSEEQDGVATSPIPRTPSAIYTAGRKLAPFLAGPRDLDDNQPGRTRWQTRSLQQGITLAASVMPDPVRGPVGQKIGTEHRKI